MTAVKICGITRREDAEAAARFGATFVGFVLWSKSPRHATLAQLKDIIPTLPQWVTPVGVFVDPTTADITAAIGAGIRVAQVHGRAPVWANGQPPVRVIRAVHLAPAGVGIEPAIDDHTVLLDAHDPERQGGTGRTVDWRRAAVIAKSRRVILAGGLTPDNVRQAINEVQPYAVDVASGVESSPGIKDHELMRAFVETALGTLGTEAP